MTEPEGEWKQEGKLASSALKKPPKLSLETRGLSPKLPGRLRQEDHKVKAYVDRKVGLVQPGNVLRPCLQIKSKGAGAGSL